MPFHLFHSQFPSTLLLTHDSRRLRARASCLCFLLSGSLALPFSPFSVAPRFFLGAGGHSVAFLFNDSARESNSSIEGPQPDVTLERLDDEGHIAQFVGEKILGDDARQTLPCPLMAGHTQTFLVHVKNIGSQGSSFTLQLEGLPSTQGKAPRWPSSGWSANATVDEQKTDLVVQLQSPGGWQSPHLAAGAEVLLRVTVTAPTKVEATTPSSSFRLTARCQARQDAVVAEVGAQAIAKLRWNAEGDPDVETNWHDVTPTTLVEVEQFTVLGVRAVKANPALDWPSPTGNGPIWTWQGQEVHGETVFLHADKVTGDIPNIATATCGNSHSVSVRVFKGDALLTFDPDDAR